ncbi:hypothetical protein ASZ90_014811 [hydrocarbon metagenome]|uniref:Uncharacterized protein n=1 Tax=hydrocarbon metagenome TaxID=938273 RepID=A0A0W8F3R3_9ZZZZ
MLLHVFITTDTVIRDGFRGEIDYFQVVHWIDHAVSLFIYFYWNVLIPIEKPSPPGGATGKP